MASGTCGSLHTQEDTQVIRRCSDEVELAKEQEQLSTKLTVWQQQIQQLVHRKARLPKRPRSRQHGSENKAPLQGPVDSLDSGVAANKSSQAGGVTPGSSGFQQSLHSVQSSCNTPAQQLGTEAGLQHSRAPTASGAPNEHRPRLSDGPGGCGAETRRKRMQQRLQAAENRRARAKEQAQVLILQTAPRLRSPSAEPVQGICQYCAGR